MAAGPLISINLSRTFVNMLICGTKKSRARVEYFLYKYGSQTSLTMVYLTISGVLYLILEKGNNYADDSVDVFRPLLVENFITP
jgi:hypothetical protein